MNEWKEEVEEEVQEMGRTRFEAHHAQSVYIEP